MQEAWREGTWLSECACAWTAGQVRIVCNELRKYTVPPPPNFVDFRRLRELIDRFFAQTLDRLLDCVRFRCADAHTFAESTGPSAARSDGPRSGVELAPHDDDTSRCGSRSRLTAGQTQRARRSELQCLLVPGGSAGVRLRDDEIFPRSYRCDAIATS